ncbi:unnamed protein product [Meloidogyne enterolobii]|uniref:Uncharacterized protein n=1 Tax=Meloidogyne enterolobii TaxID=390850 RepID=A0ACB1A5T1_MELEN
MYSKRLKLISNNLCTILIANKTTKQYVSGVYDMINIPCWKTVQHTQPTTLIHHTMH